MVSKLPITLELARYEDAARLALMARHLVEAGLPWSWTTPRIVQQLRRRDTVVVVARTGKRRVVGFAILRCGFENAHLLLLAVKPGYRRQGIGQQLLAWVEHTARTAGVARIHLEVRATNREAQTFYAALGYRMVERVPGYYQRREAALKLVHYLRLVDPDLVPRLDLEALFSSGSAGSAGPANPS
ncbi:MAG: GNAT family N-acetyltransferase [Candidatus Competibacterales bacterium]